MVDHLNQPRFRISAGVKFGESDHERLLDNVSSIFLGERVLPRGSTYEWKEELTVEIVEAGRIFLERT
jgi:hypothetical protein